ncbi:endonuclease/exonuclease/phosphatase family protein [Cellulomonas marina]|uniref:Metal-dependent hydrolase, endonuclease/exonuclease/phosphatase family n=1 Tax=Cellulomonas marina TaxID=988821 RepID=A0A1I0XH64_9CELL|nr:endonuclease/exonuclease/phosphatase family protein [Cellulomonas marina]GIG29826.1 hypothetical protein Cma02nite_24260 [Cellulomonas marina]SFB00321.1 Metal-dependent hydrolase, endonuclease/exonuclease/phosphatase family [Cellulomonas marina]
MGEARDDAAADPVPGAAAGGPAVPGTAGDRPVAASGVPTVPAAGPGDVPVPGASPAGDEEPPSLRLMTYNIKGLHLDAAAVAAVVRAQSPDVLAVQEPPRGPLGRRRLDRLARRAGLVPLVRGGGARTTALLVAPGLPTGPARALRLPWRPGRTRRGAVLAQVAGVQVLVVHLGLSAGERSRHLDRLLAAVDPAGGPLVVMGDLNEQPTGASWRRLGGRLTDAAVLGGGGVATFPAARPRLRIDAVLVEAGDEESPPPTPGRVARVVHAVRGRRSGAGRVPGVAAAAPGRAGLVVLGSWVPGGPVVARASDHRPVVVDVRPAAPAAGAGR